MVACSDLAIILTTTFGRQARSIALDGQSSQAGPEGPDLADTSLVSFGGPLLEPVRRQQPLLQEGVGVHRAPGVLAVLGLEGDQPPGPVLEGATQVAGQPQLLPVRREAERRAAYAGQLA
jgi:hypothetical protein